MTLEINGDSNVTFYVGGKYVTFLFRRQTCHIFVIAGAYGRHCLLWYMFVIFDVNKNIVIQGVGLLGKNDHQGVS